MNTLIKKHVGQLITYTSIGVIGTAAHYGTLITLVEFGEIHAVTGSTFGFVIGALLNYYLNYKVTFRSQKSHFKAMPQYFLVA
ncbi:MAG: GtrA family protein, partial [Candidatus Thorarchaeota archaeon]